MKDVGKDSNFFVLYIYIKKSELHLFSWKRCQNYTLLFWKYMFIKIKFSKYAHSDLSCDKKMQLNLF